MADYYLIVSSPPHAADVDSLTCAKLLGCNPDQAVARLKERCPQIWYAALDLNDAQFRLDAVQVLGFSGKIISSEDLRTSPALTNARSFEVGQDTMSWQHEKGKFSVPFESRLILVRGKPQLRGQIAKAGSGAGHDPSTLGIIARQSANVLEGIGRSTRRGAVKAARQFVTHTAGPAILAYKVGMGVTRLAGALLSDGAETIDLQTPESGMANAGALGLYSQKIADGSFYDAYFIRPDSSIERVRLALGSLNYTGLLDRKSQSGSENFATVIDFLASAFAEVEIDSRMVDAYLYEPNLGGKSYKLFLQSISAELLRSDVVDVTSRLAFLLAKSES